MADLRLAPLTAALIAHERHTRDPQLLDPLRWRLDGMRSVLMLEFDLKLVYLGSVGYRRGDCGGGQDGRRTPNHRENA